MPSYLHVPAASAITIPAATAASIRIILALYNPNITLYNPLY